MNRNHSTTAPIRRGDIFTAAGGAAILTTALGAVLLDSAVSIIAAALATSAGVLLFRDRSPRGGE